MAFPHQGSNQQTEPRPATLPGLDSSVQAATTTCPELAGGSASMSLALETEGHPPGCVWPWSWGRVLTYLVAPQASVTKGQVCHTLLALTGGGGHTGSL